MWWIKLNIIHLLSVLMQLPMHKNTLQHFRGRQVLRFAHAWWRPWQRWQDVVGIQSNIKYIFQVQGILIKRAHFKTYSEDVYRNLYSQVSLYFPYKNFSYEILRDRLFWKPSLPIHKPAAMSWICRALSRENVLVSANAQPCSNARLIIALLVVGGALARPNGCSNLRPHISTETST